MDLAQLGSLRAGRAGRRRTPPLVLVVAGAAAALGRAVVAQLSERRLPRVVALNRVALRPCREPGSVLYAPPCSGTRPLDTRAALGAIRHHLEVRS